LKGKRAKLRIYFIVTIVLLFSSLFLLWTNNNYKSDYIAKNNLKSDKYINITQNAKKVVYCGTFTAGGLKIDVKNNKLVIENEGKMNKFLKKVEQVTFSGEYALEIEQPVLYITERAVFELTNKGVVLTEIAPGVDLEKDILAHMDFKPVISDALTLMDERIFGEKEMGLKF